MSYDLKRTHFSDRKEYPTPLAVSISEEGQTLVWDSSTPDGIARVKPSTGAAAEDPAGFAITDAIKRTTEVVTETVTVPAVGPFTATLSQSNLEVGVIGAGLSSISAVASTTGTLVQVAAGPIAGQFAVVASTGVVTFNVAEAGQRVTVTYRYLLTQAQIDQKFQQRSVNNRAQDTFHTLSVGKGEGEIYTDQYDTALVYALLDTVKTAGPGSGAGFITAAGRLSKGGSGTAFGTVIKLPTTGGDGLLGVKFKLPH